MGIHDWTVEHPFHAISVQKAIDTEIEQSQECVICDDECGCIAESALEVARQELLLKMDDALRHHFVELLGDHVLEFFIVVQRISNIS